MPRTSLSRARDGLMFRATKIISYVKLLQAQGIAARRLLATPDREPLTLTAA